MDVTLKELLENGVYFGHPSRQFDPRMKPYLYGKRQGIYIIDIEKTQEKLREAAEYLRRIAAEKKQVLFLGTKKQAQPVVTEIAQRLNMPYVSYRWIGGTLTNFPTIRARINRLDEIEEMEKAGLMNRYTKKEISLFQKERANLLKKFGGIRHLTEFPASMVVVDVKREINAIREARKAGVSIVGIVDTNCNPELVDYPVPANDDGLKSIRLILTKLAEAITEGLLAAGHPSDMVEKAVLEASRESESEAS